MHCICKGWLKNIDVLEGPLAFLHTKHPDIYKDYADKVFEFCPWCGAKLVSNTEDDSLRLLREKLREWSGELEKLGVAIYTNGAYDILGVELGNCVYGMIIKTKHPTIYSFGQYAELYGSQFTKKGE